MTFHRLFFATAVGLAGTALIITSLWSGYAALGTGDTSLGWLAVGLGIPGAIAVVYGYRAMRRETEE